MRAGGCGPRAHVQAVGRYAVVSAKNGALCLVTERSASPSGGRGEERAIGAARTDVAPRARRAARLLLRGRGGRGGSEVGVGVGVGVVVVVMGQVPAVVVVTVY